MRFLPIEADDEMNGRFKDNPECLAILDVFKVYYLRVGFEKPWIAYFAINTKDQIVGAAGFKGRPKDGKVEISYGTFKDFQGQGVGAELCKHLVSMALHTDPSIKITARTLPENNASIRVLKKSGFDCTGTVFDEEDGNVLEWIFIGSEPDRSTQ